MKNGLFIFVLSLTFLGIRPAYADFEAIETAMGVVEKIQNKYENVEEKLKDVEAMKNKVRQGVTGVKEMVPTEIPNVKKVEIKQLKSVADAVGDKKSLEGVIGQDFVPNYTGQNPNAIFEEVQDTIEATKREDIARLYAHAFTTRTIIEKNRQEVNDDAVSADNPREARTQATKEATEANRRLAQALDMYASIAEFDYKLRLQGFSKDIGLEEGEGE